MRAFITGLLTCCVVLLASGSRGQDGMPPPSSPNCNGTSPKKGACDGKVPTGYYQSASCQGDLPTKGSRATAL